MEFPLTRSPAQVGGQAALAVAAGVRQVRLAQRGVRHAEVLQLPGLPVHEPAARLRPQQL